MKKKSSRKKSVRKRKNKKPIFWALLKSRWFLRSLLLLGLAFIIYIIILDFQVRSVLDGRIWSIPSTVYARAMELYPGAAVTKTDFVNELKRLGYQEKRDIPTGAGQYRQWQNNVEVYARDFQFADGHQKALPLHLAFSSHGLETVQTLYKRTQVSLYRLEPPRIAAIYPQRAEERELLKLDEVPDYLILTLLAVEDRRFYEHHGIDPVSIGRALFANLRAGRTVQGGSTITQQLVKNIFLSSERSLLRKINEAFMALLVELHYSKALILETYLNEVYLGQDGNKSINGFALASRFYFDQPLAQLSREKLALLVGLVKGPSWYDPWGHPQRALERRNQVLDVMRQLGVMDDSHYRLFKRRPLGVVSRHHLAANRYPAFIQIVKHQLFRDYSSEELKTAGLRIFTTLDPIVQEQVNRSVTRMLPRISSDDALQTAVIVTSAHNGEIRAAVGDRDPEYAGFDRVLNAKRQIGSLAKPVLYLTALQQNPKLTLASLVDDSPVQIKLDNGDIWQPENYDNQYRGNILLYQAFAQSRNIPAVRVGMAAGLQHVVDNFHALGIVEPVPAYPSILLGSITPTPYEVAEMFQSFASGGFRTPLRAINDVVNQQGKVLKRYPLEVKQVMDAAHYYLVNYVLQTVTRTGTAQAIARNPLTAGRQYAGKTGTTNDLRDSWFAGYSGQYQTLAWVGRDDNKPTGLTGASGALKLWIDIMGHIPDRSLNVMQPDNIRREWVNQKNGLKTDKGCRDGVQLPFISGTEPVQTSECDSPSLFQSLKSVLP